MPSFNNCQPNKRRVRITNASENLQILQKVPVSKGRKNQGSVLLRKTWQSSVTLMASQTIFTCTAPAQPQACCLALGRVDQKAVLGCTECDRRGRWCCEQTRTGKLRTKGKVHWKISALLYTEMVKKNPSFPTFLSQRGKNFLQTNYIFHSIFQFCAYAKKYHHAKVKRFSEMYFNSFGGKKYV